MNLIPVRYLGRDPMGEKVSPGEQSCGVPRTVQAQLRGTVVLQKRVHQPQTLLVTNDIFFAFVH